MTMMMMRIILSLVLEEEGKVKCTVVQVLRLCTGRTARTGSRGIALLFLDHGTRRGEWSASRPGRSLPPWKTRYPLYMRLGGPQGRFGQVWRISSSPGFDPRTVQPVASRYTEWATGPTLEEEGRSKERKTESMNEWMKAKHEDMTKNYLSRYWLHSQGPVNVVLNTRIP